MESTSREGGDKVQKMIFYDRLLSKPLNFVPLFCETRHFCAERPPPGLVGKSVRHYNEAQIVKRL